MRFQNGTKFADFTILSLLGRGGMAAVYLAREAGLERLVALKILPEQLVDDHMFAERFEQEARVIAGLDHPSIIPLYRYGITDEVPWMALRYVNGGDLEPRLKERELETAKSITILRSVASALDYAHMKGVIHRDLKPQNILLTEENAPYLADFGVAKLLEGAEKLKTATGNIFGTPAYMAPEQALGQTLGPYTDVYALAVIAYRALTGDLPFDADTPHAILMKHVSEPLPQTVTSMLPVAVADVLERGLAKDPKQRIQSASRLIEELDRALKSTDTTPVRFTVPQALVESRAKAMPEQTTTAMPTSRKRIVHVFSAVVGLIFVGGALMIGYRWRLTDHGLSREAPAQSEPTHNDMLLSGSQATSNTAASTGPQSSSAPPNTVQASNASSPLLSVAAPGQPAYSNAEQNAVRAAGEAPAVDTHSVVDPATATVNETRTDVACVPGEQPVFSCTTTRGKRIAVCQADGSVIYNFGRAGAKPEMSINEPTSGVMWAMARTNGVVQDTLTFQLGTTRYRINNNNLGATLDVFQREKILTTIQCLGDTVRYNVSNLMATRQPY